MAKRITILAMLAGLAGMAHAETPLPCPVPPAEISAATYPALIVRNDSEAGGRLSRLIACLGEPDPAIRDDFALTALTAALRSDHFPPALLRPARDQLLAALLDRNDPHGVRRPFAAMALSEIARVDRIKPFLAPLERRTLAQAAIAYLRGVTDYRGFTTGEGWRHGVAHGADWLMQLALHPELHSDDAAAMLDAIAVQIAPPGTHSFVHGESGRLARPLLFLAAGSKVNDAQLAAFLAKLKPDGSARWSAAYSSEEGLAALHNTRAFAIALLVEALRSETPGIQRLEPLVVDLLRAIP